MSDYALPRGTLTGAPVDWTWQPCPRCAHTYRIWVLGLPRQARPDWCCPACRREDHDDLQRVGPLDVVCATSSPTVGESAVLGTTGSPSLGRLVTP